MSIDNKFKFESRVSLAAPGVLRTNPDCSIVDERLIKILSEYHYGTGRNISRCCVHKSNDSLLMLMVIIVTGKYIYPPHKHDWKDESYSIVCGECEYIEYNAEGEVNLRKTLSRGDIYMNENKTFHALVPSTDELIFVEHTMGPFTESPLKYLKNRLAP